MKSGEPLVIIRRSCITGKPVYLFVGHNKGTARKSYYRACEREVQRFRQWPNTVKRIKGNIMRLLNNCMASVPITAEFTREQRAAARELIRMSKQEMPYQRDFYDHVVTSRRQRLEDRKMRRLPT